MRGIPWQLILKQAPSLMDAASRLLSISRPRPDEISAAKDLNALRDQVAALANDQHAHADLLKQVADQLNAIATGTQTAAKRAHWAMIVGGGGLVLAIVACLLAVLQ